MQIKTLNQTQNLQMTLTQAQTNNFMVSGKNISGPANYKSNFNNSFTSGGEGKQVNYKNMSQPKTP